MAYFEMLTACLFLYAVFISFKIFKKRGKWAGSIDEFFSVDKFKNEKQFLTYFSRSFESTNVSFTTTFVGFFYLTQYNIMYGVNIAIGFVLGIVIYSKIFIPLKFDEARKGHYYPEIIANAAGSIMVSKITYAFLACSMLMFYYTEVYGFFNVIINIHNAKAGISLYAVVILTLAVMFFYILSGGYKNIIHTDSFQALIIRAGAIALIVLAAIILVKHDISATYSIIVNDFNIVEAIASLLLGVVAFLFAQIVYIENWQRIVIFLKSYDVSEDQNSKIISNIQNSLYKVSFNLIIMYSVPIFLAVYAKSIGIGHLHDILIHFWNAGATYKILLTVSFFGFISALYSTMDTFILAVLESVTRLFGITEMRKLQTVSFVAVFFVVPFMFLKLDIRSWFEFIFLTYNVFAAPLIFSLIYKDISKKLFLWLSISGLILFTYLGLALPDMLMPFNLVFILVSFSLIYFSSKNRQRQMFEG